MVERTARASVLPGGEGGFGQDEDLDARVARLVSICRPIAAWTSVALFISLLIIILILMLVFVLCLSVARTLSAEPTDNGHMR